MNAPKGSYPAADDARRQFRATGEFRAPRAGEWYLSGAIVEAYKAPHDMMGGFWIAREVTAAECGAQDVVNWLARAVRIKCLSGSHAYVLPERVIDCARRLDNGERLP